MSTTRDIKFSYNDLPTIRDFAFDNAFIRGLIGPVGGGKSSGCTVELATRGLAQAPGPDGVRRTRFAVIRDSYPMLRDTTIKTVFQWFPPEYFGKYTESQHKYVIKAFEHTEIEILFRALDRPDDIQNLLSMELTGAWINEARTTPWAIVDTLQGRVGRFPAKRDGGATWFGLWMDTNAPDVDSKWYRFFEEQKHPATFARIFKQPSGMSPEAENLANLPGGRRYYENLMQGKSDEWINVYIHGKYGFVMDGKPVFPEYNDRLHCQKIDPVEGRPIIRGYDFGLTPACCFSQILPDGRWLVFDELVSENMGIERFSEEVLEHSSRCFPRGARFEDYGDPAGQQRAQTDERTCFDILQAKGILIEPGLQTLAIRIESIRKPLRTLTTSGEPQFILHPRCRNLRKGFQGGYHYRRMQTHGERYTSQPEKNDLSHVMDSCQYPATILFGGGLTNAAAEYDDYPRLSEYSEMGRNPETGY